MRGPATGPPDVVVVRGAPDADELAALMAVLAVLAGSSVAGVGVTGVGVTASTPARPRPPATAGSRVLATTDRFWFTGYSPH